MGPNCPSCSVRIHFNDFLQTHAVLALVDHISGNIRRELKKNDDREICKEHNMTMNYYCLECNVPLCGDCGMLTNKVFNLLIQHQNHRFMSYRDIYERIKSKVYDEFPRFDKKLKTLGARKDNLRLKVENLHD
jgi:hypothetical protein